MGYTLNKPFTDTEKANFVHEHQGLNYYEDDNCIIMYLDSESVTNGVITDISGTDSYKAKIKVQQIQQAMATRDNKYDNFSNSILWDIIAMYDLDNLLANSTITQAEYDTQKAMYNNRIKAKATLFRKAQSDFYVATGLTEKSITQ